MNEFVNHYFNQVPQGAKLVLFVWGVMFFLRLIDSWFLKNKLVQLLGAYSFRSPQKNNIFRFLFYPFVHGNWKHLGGNSAVFIVLGATIAWAGFKQFLYASLIINIFVFLGVFIFEKRTGPTIGASGLITGYFGYILLRAFIDKDLISIIVAIVVLILYQGVVYAILIRQKGSVSNIGHVFGFLGGLIAVYTYPYFLDCNFL